MIVKQYCVVLEPAALLLLLTCCSGVQSVTDDWWQHQHVDESRYLMDIFTLCNNDEQGYDGDHELSSLNYQG